jgi:hypothetical protein
MSAKANAFSHHHLSRLFAAYVAFMFGIAAAFVIALLIWRTPLFAAGFFSGVALAGLMKIFPVQDRLSKLFDHARRALLRA